MQSEHANLILTGLMGAGKTTLGRSVSKVLEREFVDTDEYIEANYGPASSILQGADGDQRFREIEQQVAGELSSRSDLIIATGGRFMLNPVNIELMLRTGVVLCLVADVDELVQRLLDNNSTTYRPRFDNATNKREFMIDVAKQSDSYFAAFEKLDTSDLTTDAATMAILEWYGV